LNAHSEATKVDLLYREALDTPIETEVLQLTKAAGVATMKAFKKAGKGVKEWLEKLPEEQLKAIADEVKAGGKATRTVDLPDGTTESCTFLPEHVVCETQKVKVSTTTFMPGVVEPSFGIDRILFATLEHSYYCRPKEADSEEKQTRGVLAFPAIIAPYKITILPQDQRICRDDKYEEILGLIRKRVTALGHTCTVDDSNATLGKRYSRNDELGIPFACTVDFDSLKDDCVTLRERDSMAQVRLPVKEVGQIIHELCGCRKTWVDVCNAYPKV